MSVQGAVEQLQNEVPSAQPNLPEPTQEGSDQYLGFIDKTSPLGNAVTPAVNLFNETLNRNQEQFARQGVETFRSFMEPNNQISSNNLGEFIKSNPVAFNQLSAKELNKLRTIYGKSLINKFIK